MKKLPKFDEIKPFNCHDGVYKRSRVQDQSLTAIKAFVDEAIALHGGESIFSMYCDHGGYPGYISLDLEKDILAERQDEADAAERNQERLRVWNSLTPEQQKALS